MPACHTRQLPFSIAGCRPDMGKWAALVSTAHSARFSISGRHSAIENGTYTFCRSLIQPHSFPSYGVLHAFSCQVLSSSLGWLALLHAVPRKWKPYSHWRQTDLLSLSTQNCVSLANSGNFNGNGRYWIAEPSPPSHSLPQLHGARGRKALIYLFVRKLKLHS